MRHRRISFATVIAALAFVAITSGTVSAQSGTGLKMSGTFADLPDAGLTLAPDAPVLASFVLTANRSVPVALPVWLVPGMIVRTLDAQVVNGRAQVHVANGDLVNVELMSSSGVLFVATVFDVPTIAFDGVVSSVTPPDPGGDVTTITVTTGSGFEGASIPVAIRQSFTTLETSPLLPPRNPLVGDSLSIKGTIVAGRLYATDVICPFCVQHPNIAAHERR